MECVYFISLKSVPIAHSRQLGSRQPDALDAAIHAALAEAGAEIVVLARDSRFPRHGVMQVDVRVAGSSLLAGELLKRDWIPNGWFNVATFQEPGWRIEGKKTMGYELFEQFDGDLPEVVLYPTGGGTGLGLEIALTMARRGAAVAIASRSPEHLEAGRGALEAEGARTLGVPLIMGVGGSIDIVAGNGSGEKYIPFEFLRSNFISILSASEGAFST